MAAAASCSSKEDGDDGANPGTAGSAGSGMIDAGSDADGVGGDDGAGGSDGPGDGVSTESQCVEIKGLENPESCGTTAVEAEYRTANVMLVIDKSGSMTDKPGGFDTNKWDALNSALQAALPEVAGDMNFGLIMYPYSATDPIPEVCTAADTNCCDVPSGAEAVNVPIGPGSDSVPQILETVQLTAPGGGTPTAQALTAAYQYFTQGAGTSLEGDKYVLLATDGGPNCNSLNSCQGDTCTVNLDDQCPSENCCGGVGNGKYCLDDQSVIDQINLLKDAGIPTFVIGIPGTEAYSDYLNSFALAGGVPNTSGDTDYFAVSAEGGVQALADTFTSITQTLVRSCDVALTSEPPRDDLVNVAVNCEIVPHDDGAGWEIPADNRTTLVLKGGTCEWIQSQGARRIDIIYGCMTIK